MAEIKRAILLVLDSVGVGAMPDAASFGDAGADTLGHLALAAGGLSVPNLARLGLGNIHRIAGVEPEAAPAAAFGRMALKSQGKDTVTGHWEMSGCLVPEAFGLFPDGFPAEIIRPFEALAGKPVLGNKAASGTTIIEELGEEHVRTGRPIVYTSADSVFQVAAHEAILPPDRLYELCQGAFEIVKPFRVARVIARPFVHREAGHANGATGRFRRTVNRRDFSLVPTSETVMDRALAAGLEVWSVGKVASVFGHRGFSREIAAKGNKAVVDETLLAMESMPAGLLFANLVDFDMEYGHRRDPLGYAAALEAFDARLPEFLARLSAGDLFLILADHGNDPCFRGTDHTREFVPLLAVMPGVRSLDLGLREQLSDAGATIAEHLGLGVMAVGRSFLRDVLPGPSTLSSP